MNIAGEEESIYRNQLSALIWGISKAFTTSHLYILEYSPRTKTQSLSYFTQSLKLLKIKASNLSTACFRCQFFYHMSKLLILDSLCRLSKLSTAYNGSQSCRQPVSAGKAAHSLFQLLFQLQKYQTDVQFGGAPLIN